MADKIIKVKVGIAAYSSGLTMVMDDRLGFNIPAKFRECFERPNAVSDWAWEEISSGYNDGYWEAWDSILNNAYYSIDLGDGVPRKFVMHHDGDVWLVCDELLSDTDYENFFGVIREA